MRIACRHIGQKYVDTLTRYIHGGKDFMRETQGETVLLQTIKAFNCLTNSHLMIYYNIYIELPHKCMHIPLHIPTLKSRS